MRLSATVITKNEERNIAECLSALSFCDEIVVVDSGSTDRTVEIARGYTDQVLHHDFKDFSDQKNFALSKATGDWVLSIDADERVLEPLQQEILSAVKGSDGLGGYRIPRQTYYLKKRFRFSGTQDDAPLRLFLKDAGQFVQPIHEYFETQRPIGILKAPLLHLTTRSVKEEIEKTWFYTELEARFLLQKDRKVGVLEREARCGAIFLYHYFWKLGLWDGWEGFLFAFYAQRYTRMKYRKLRDDSGRQALEKKIGTRFDEHAPKLPDTIDRADRRLGALLEACGDVDGKKVLEVGCGKGRFAEVMIERGAELTGLDPSEELLKHARKLHGEFVYGSATMLPFKEGQFDVVYAVEVIEHLPQLEPAIREMARVLKKDGVLVLIDRNKFSFNHQRFLAPNLLIKTWHELKNDWMYPRNFPFREKWFTKGQILKLMKPLFTKRSAKSVLSDGESACAWRGLFKAVPAVRLFVLWRGVKK